MSTQDTIFQNFNGASFSVIYNYLLSTQNKEWLDHATKAAEKEMISDVDEVVLEVKEVIRAARKSVPLRYKLIYSVKSWLQKLK